MFAFHYKLKVRNEGRKASQLSVPNIAITHTADTVRVIAGCLLGTVL